MKRSKGITCTTYVILSVGLVLILTPFYLTVVSAFKTTAQLHNNFFGLPESLYLDNFSRIFSKNDYFYGLWNSLFITITSVILCAVCLPMAAYPVARRMHGSRVYKFLYIYMVAGIFVPFIVRMMPVINLLNTWKLANKWGLILIYLGGATCEGIFLITGFLSTIPTDLEEAAYIDGAGTARVFFHVVYPVITPIVATVAIKNSLWFWNDFLLPSLIMRKPQERTLVLFQYNFKGEYATEYPMVFACLLLAMLPIMVFYFFMQKSIINGIMTGSIKG